MAKYDDFLDSDSPWPSSSAPSRNYDSFLDSDEPWQPSQPVTAAPEASAWDRTKDTGVDLAKGVVGLGESAVGVLDLASGNLIGKGLKRIGYDPQRTRQMLESGYSAERQQENAEVQAAEGFLDTVVAMVQNPAVAIGTVVESSPMLLGTAGAVRAAAVNMLAKRGIQAGTQAAVDFLKSAPVRARLATIGAAAEGALTAGSNQEQARQADRGYLESAPYSIGAGVATGIIGKVASRFPGLGDIETSVGTAGMGNKTTQSIGKRVAAGMFQEGVLEEMPQSAQEQIFSNLALGNEWNEGVAEAAGTGMIAGGIMGGGFNALQRRDDSAAETINRIVGAPDVDSAIAEADSILRTVTPGESRSVEAVETIPFRTGTPAGARINPDGTFEATGIDAASTPQPAESGLPNSQVDTIPYIRPQAITPTQNVEPVSPQMPAIDLPTRRFSTGETANPAMAQALQRALDAKTIAGLEAHPEESPQAAFDAAQAQADAQKDADYERALAQENEQEIASLTGQPILRTNGQPFATAAMARASQQMKNNPGAEVVQVEGGFGIQPKVSHETTAPEQSATDNANRSILSPSNEAPKIDPAPNQQDLDAAYDNLGDSAKSLLKDWIGGGNAAGTSMKRMRDAAKRLWGGDASVSNDADVAALEDLYAKGRSTTGVGKTIRLYRGLRSNTDGNTERRGVESYTTDERVARNFAGADGKVEFVDVPVEAVIFNYGEAEAEVLVRTDLLPESKPAAAETITDADYAVPADERVTDADYPPASKVLPFSNTSARDSSWVIRNKETGEVIMETFDRKKVDALNTTKYEAVPVQQHLAEVNNPETVAGAFARGQKAPSQAQTAAASPRSADFQSIVDKSKTLAEARKRAAMKFGKEVAAQQDGNIVDFWEAKKRANRVKASTTISPNDSIRAAIAKLGGINMAWMEDMTGDTKQPPYPGLFTKTGTSPDDMAQKLVEAGYIVGEDYNKVATTRPDDDMRRMLKDEIAKRRMYYPMSSKRAERDSLDKEREYYEDMAAADEARLESQLEQIAAEHGQEAADQARQYHEDMQAYNLTLAAVADAGVESQLAQEREYENEARAQAAAEADAAEGSGPSDTTTGETGRRSGEADRSPEDFGLTPETESSRIEREARAQDSSIEQRAQIDREREQFSLDKPSGNVSGVGQATSKNQKTLFSQDEESSQSAYQRSLQSRRRNVDALREDSSPLSEYDEQSQREWLRGATPPKNGKIKLYRAMRSGQKVQPGDYVTNSRQYARDHLKNNMGGDGYVQEFDGSLDEIFPADGPGEFWYAPKRPLFSQDDVTSTPAFDPENPSILASQEGEDYGISRQRVEQMLERAYNVYREGLRDEGINSWRDWLAAKGAADVALHAESEYEIYNRYLSNLPDAITAADVLRAYQAGTLPASEQQKKATAAIDIPAVDSPPRGTPGEPVAIKRLSDKQAKRLWEIANTRATKTNRAAVERARYEIFMQHAQASMATQLGVSEKDINAKIKSWSNFSGKALALQNALNAGRSMATSWTGITNLSFLSQRSVKPETVDQFVKEVIANDKSWNGPDGTQLRDYIMRTMLGMDTRINYQDLTFIVDTTLKPLGQYSNSNRTIAIRSNSPHTVAHEIGHYLDAKWGKEGGDNFNFASDSGVRRDFIVESTSELRAQWMDRFKEFVMDISERSEIGSAYYQDRKEVFARFVDKFMQWAETTAGVKRWTEDRYARDRFHEGDYRRFVRLLQEKAYVDIADGNPLGNAKGGADFTTSQQPTRNWLTAETGSPGMTVEEVTSAIAKPMENLKQQFDLDVVVLQSPKDLPAAAQMIDPKKRIRGAYHEGVVYLFADNLQSPRGAQVTLAHELVGHKGVLEAVTAEEWASIKKTIDMLRKGGNKTAKDIWAEVDRRYSGADEETKFKEFLAIAAEKRVLRTKMETLWAKVRAALRRVFRTMGFQMFPDAELEIILSNSEKYLRESGEAMQEAEGTLAAANAPTFYSALLNTLKTDTSSPRKGSAQQWKAWLDGRQKAGAIKKGERDWLGIDAWLEGRETTTREDMQKFIEANQVQVQDVVLGRWESAAMERRRPIFEQYQSQLDALDETIRNPASTNRIRSEALAERERLMAERDAAADNESGKEMETKFASYQLPGGDNYRELLLTLPTVMADTKWTVKDLPDGKAEVTTPKGLRRIWPNRDAAEAWIRSTGAHDRAADAAGAFKSPHFDQPNILAHVRFNERTDADGNKVLFVEEIQSDWAQKGRKEGFVGQLSAEIKAEEQALVTEKEKLLSDFGGMHGILKAVASSDQNAQVARERISQINYRLSEIDGLRGNIRTVNRGQKVAVPDMPFKNTDEWAMLAFKRMVRYAAENGFQKIAWTTGAQQADRYNLSKQVDVVSVYKHGEDQYDIEVLKDREGGRGLFDVLMSESGIGIARVEELVGKELAKKISEQKNFNKEYRGLDLKVGGEGMRGFYDKILPAAVNKWAKKFGGKVGATELVTAATKADVLERGITPGAERAQVPSLTLTDSMREAALSGQPLFSQLNSELTLNKLKSTGHSDSIQENGQVKLYRGKGASRSEMLYPDKETAQKAAFYSDGELEEVTVDPGTVRPEGRGYLPEGALFSQGSQTDTPEFRAWFKKSVVVNDDGTPKVMFHGTGTEFDEFDPGMTSDNGLHFGTAEQADHRNEGFKPDHLAGKIVGGERVLPVYLSLQNPLRVEDFGGDAESWSLAIEDAKKEGYDGLVYRNQWEGDGTQDSYVAFRPEQVKSAIGNRGTFDPSNPNILFSQDEEGEFAQENARIREEDKTLWNKAKREMRRQLTPAGLLPDSVFKAKIARDNKLQVVEFDAAHLIGNLERAIRKDYGIHAGKLSEADLNALSDALGGKIPPSVKGQTKAALIAMREYIDAQSKQYVQILREQVTGMAGQLDEGEQKLLQAFLSMSRIDNSTGTPQEKGAATKQRNAILDDAKAQAKELWGDGKQMQESLGRVATLAEKISLIETITANEGTYVHRSYQAFDDPDWPKKVPDKVLNDARAYLMNRLMSGDEPMTEAAARTRARVLIEDILKEGTAYDNLESFIKESKLGAKDLSVLKTRKRIAPEIRALLGEHKDPRLNFAKSVTKMGRLIWNQRFLDRVREVGMGDFLFTEENRPPNTTKIAAEGSEVYSPLNGLYAEREVAQAFKDALGKEQMANWYKAIVQLNGIVKYGKTILSPTTAARNWQSAAFFTLANGHFNWKEIGKSVSGLREYFTHAGEGEKLAYLRKLKDLGVVYDTPYAGEMMRLLDDSAIEKMVSGSDAAMGIRKAMDMAQKFYQYGDDFWKIVGFENQKRDLMKFAGMNEKDAEIEAAERIRNTYPTYSMVGRGVQSLRRFPLVGTFVSFPAEIIRTTFNMLKYLQQDWQNPKTRPMAVKRAAGLMFAAGFAAALQEMSKQLFDIDDDDEEAIRLQAAPWQQNSNLVFAGRDEKGNIRYFDISFLDPYSYWKKPITAIMRDQPWEEEAAAAAGELLQPFLGTDILAGAIFQVAANKKDTGGEVYKETDSPDRQLMDIANHLRKSLQPGIASNLERTYKAMQGETSASGQKYNLHDEAMGWLGWRVTTLDPKVALYYRSFDFNDAKSDASRTLTQVLTSPNSVGSDDIADAYDLAVKMRAQAYSDMQKMVSASRRSGMNDAQIRTTLRGASVSQADIVALLNGTVPRWVPTRQAEASAVRRAEAILGPEKAREIRQRYQAARREATE